MAKPRTDDLDIARPSTRSVEAAKSQRASNLQDGQAVLRIDVNAALLFEVKEHALHNRTTIKEVVLNALEAAGFHVASSRTK